MNRRLGDTVTLERRSGESGTCAPEAAHTGVERGRSDSPDERVTLSTRASSAEPREPAGAERIQPGGRWGSGSQQALLTTFRTLIFFKRDRKSLESFCRDEAYVSWGRAGCCLLCGRQEGKRYLIARILGERWC